MCSYNSILHDKQERILEIPSVYWSHFAPHEQQVFNQAVHSLSESSGRWCFQQKRYVWNKIQLNCYDEERNEDLHCIVLLALPCGRY